MTTMAAERLQKVLAHAGVASRRAAEQLIREGRVTVNGGVVQTLGTRVDPQRDRIAVDGQPLPLVSKRTYVMLHKPRGLLSTASDERGRPTVVELVGTAARLYPAGRLDADSEGLLLLTDDGRLAYRLTHPRHHVPKEYHVRVRDAVTDFDLARLREGIVLPEGTATAEVDVLKREPSHTWLRVVLRQGWKRQIRRMLAAVGHPVERLIRTRIGGLELGDLPPGRWRALTEQDVARALEAPVAVPDHRH